MKKLIVTLAAAALLIAGCSGSDDQAEPTAKSAATPSAEDDARQQAKERAERAEMAQEELAKKVSDEAAGARGKIVKIDIADGKVTPQGDRVELKSGQRVRLVMTSDVAEEIHVHSDPEHTFQLVPGELLSEEITLDRPGQVAVEAHHLGVTIVQLVVRP